MNLTQLLGYACFCDFPQTRYRSLMGNEGYMIPSGEAAWQDWAQSNPCEADLRRVAETLDQLRSVTPHLRAWAERKPEPKPEPTPPQWRCDGCGLRLEDVVRALACLRATAPEPTHRDEYRLSPEEVRGDLCPR